MPIVTVSGHPLEGSAAELVIAVLKSIVPQTPDYYEFGNGLDQAPTRFTRFTAEDLHQVQVLAQGDGTQLAEQVPQAYTAFLEAAENGEGLGLRQVQTWLSAVQPLCNAGGYVLN